MLEVSLCGNCNKAGEGSKKSHLLFSFLLGFLSQRTPSCPIIAVQRQEMVQTREHSKGRGPKPQPDKKEPKQDHGRRLQPPVACNSCKDEKQNVDLCCVNTPDKILLKWGVQGKEATAD